MAENIRKESRDNKMLNVFKRRTERVVKWIKMIVFPPGEVKVLEKFMKSTPPCVQGDIIYDISEEKGNFSFWIYNMMLSRMVMCEYKGYPYMLHITASHDGYNLWDAFFEKRGMTEEPIPQGMKIKKLDLATPVDFHLERMDVRDKRQRKLLHMIGKKYAKLNETTQRYIDDEYNALLSGRKVLGVLYRGTDYVKLRPPGHPVQPTLEQLAQECIKRIAKRGYKYIYITTDEKRAVDYFIEKFPHCQILVNKRNYFDEFYEKPTTRDIAACRHDRENDKYLTALEYLSSVYLLSRCDELVAGDCGGSRQAMILNGEKYKYVKIFDLGKY